MPADCDPERGGLNEETHRPVRFRRWVSELALTFRQFLPSPEAPVVLVLIMVMDVVPVGDDIEALIELARENINRR